jgi:hypothetical protein
VQNKPDPIEESLNRAEREHSDRPTNRRWLWFFVVPFVLVFLITILYVLVRSANLR